MHLSEWFWSATQEEQINGFLQNDTHYVCLLCGKKIEKGIIYSDSGVMYEASRYMRLHLENKHRSVFEYLLTTDKKLSGLSEHQRSILFQFYQGKSDQQIQQNLGIGSSSTIRNHRFILKEKERSAKVFLVIMELLKNRMKDDKHETNKNDQIKIIPHTTATMIDDRYNVTADEYEKVLKKYFSDGATGKLSTFSMKEKNKLIVLKEITKRFQQGKMYKEKEVNEILASVFHDFVTLRRYLIEYGFMDRKNDGGQYWLKETNPSIENQKEHIENMNRKKDLKTQYKEIKVEAGIYQIRNTVNNKIFVVATKNLKTMNGRYVELTQGNHRNKILQADWNQFGRDAFVFEVLEKLQEGDGDGDGEEGDKKLNQDEALKRLEEKWLSKLKPYGELGYNKQINK